jgi:hypothetical protein
MSHGPKPKTAKNSRSKPQAHGSVEPTSKLAAVALKEFQRLAAQLDLRGTLDRVDASVLTECARIKEMLDVAFTLNDDKMIGKLMLHRRGLLRELGLTLQPSRSVVKTTAKAALEDDKWAGKLKVAGY